MFLRLRRREIELEGKKRHRNQSRFATVETVETGASRLQNSRFATVFFWGAHRIHVFAPAAPWDRVRGKNGIEIGVEMAEISNENRSK